MADRSPRALLRFITEPPASMRESERRRSRLLAWLLLVLLGLAVVALIEVFAAAPADSPTRGRYALLIAGLIVLLLAAYGLNRTGHYFAGARLTIAIATLGTWASVALETSVPGGNIVSLAFAVLPVFLGSLLLSVAATTLLAAVQITAILLLPLLYPALISSNWPSLVLFVGFLSTLCVVASFIIQQDLVQIERQSRQLAESEARLRELSVRDALTGLFNRRYLDETLERELRRAERAHLTLGIVMSDIDHFKRFNDTYGHAVGDAALRDLGALLRANVRGSDIACRYGGEEFILLLPEATCDVTRARAEHIRDGARRLGVLQDGRTVEPLTLSIGVAAFPQDGATGEALLKAVDDALYRAKREGRDRIALASQAPPC